MNDELKHYGILGMHWGVRRYQNPDGTRTEAGKRRYRQYDTVDEYLVRTKNKRAELDFVTDDELQKAIRRLNAEKAYKDLKKKDISRGEERVLTALKVAGGVLAIAASLSVIRNANKSSDGRPGTTEKELGSITDELSDVVKVLFGGA